MAKVAVTALLAVPAAYVGVTALATVALQNRLVYCGYWPVGGRGRTAPQWLRDGIASGQVREWWLRAADATRLQTFCINTRAPGVGGQLQGRPLQLVYLQGNAGSVYERHSVINMLCECLRRAAPDRPSRIVYPHYRGYGQSGGRSTERGLQLDAEAVMDDVLRPDMDTIVYGHSIGGAVTLYAASHPKYRDRVAGVVLENTFTSVEAVMRSHLPPVTGWLLHTAVAKSRILRRCLLWNEWPNADRIQRVTAPMLITAGQRDEIFPCTESRELHKLAATNNKGNARLVEFALGMHDTTWQQPGFSTTLTAFIADTAYK